MDPVSVVLDLIHPCLASGAWGSAAHRHSGGGRVAKDGIGGAVMNRTPLAQEPVVRRPVQAVGNCSVIKLACRATSISLHPRACFNSDEEEMVTKVQKIANYIQGKLKTEKKVSLNELGERFPSPSEEFDAVSRLMRAEGCIEASIPGDRWIMRPWGSAAVWRPHSPYAKRCCRLAPR
jgi:hypothetical protein